MLERCYDTTVALHLEVGVRGRRERMMGADVHICTRMYTYVHVCTRMYLHMQHKNLTR
jgi:hypothetical protein